MSKQVGAFFQALEAREDLKKYDHNRLLLFALELKRNIEDIHTVASQALIDGSDDKKCDLVFVDTDKRSAIIAQAYFAQTQKKAAPANKASDLNTTIPWLLSMDIELVPERIKYAAIELRQALESSSIDTIEFWFVHNLPESENVKKELAAVENSAKTSISARYPDSKCDEIRAIEIGRETLERWYRETKAHILVSETLSLQIPGGYRLDTEEWSAYTTAVPAKWLYELYRKHKTDLFSANYRDYLGSRQSDRNINNGIKRSAENQPDQFWVFNNGITALVNSFELDLDDEKKEIRIDGISIVNGAQTTGAIGSLDNSPDENAMVPIRFIECADAEIVQEIVRYNNSQNRMRPSDFRSTDDIQKRLRQEFDKHKAKVIYSGGRRGGADDAIRRRQNRIPSDTVTQALTAFHGDPIRAYKYKSRIWDEDKYYTKVFNDQTHAGHILFVYSLHKTILDTKEQLTEKVKSGTKLTTTEQNKRKFLSLRGSVYLLINAIGECMESILNKSITSKFLLRFNEETELSTYEERWSSIVQFCVAFNSTLRNPLEKSSKNEKETEAAIESAINEFRSMLDATLQFDTNRGVVEQFADTVLLTLQ